MHNKIQNTDNKKNARKFCGKQSKTAENVNGDPVGVSPNHENRNANDSKQYLHL